MNEQRMPEDGKNILCLDEMLLLMFIGTA